jgi:hypothetical protein
VASDADGNPHNIPLSGTGTDITPVINLLTNGSFEIDVAVPIGAPDSWKAKNLNLSTTTDGLDCDPGNFSDGACSMRFVGDGNGSKIQQDINLTGLAGDAFTLTFDSKSLNASTEGSYSVTLSIFHTNGGKDKVKLNVPEGTNSWSDYVINLEATRNYKKLRVQIKYTGNAGFVWFDDFVLTQD